MTIAELIAQLQTVPPETEVRVEVPCCCGNDVPATKAVIEPELKYDDHQKKWLPTEIRYLKLQAEDL